MDDTLEQPKHSPNLNISGERNEDHEQDASDGEDGGLDWTKLPYVFPPLPLGCRVIIDLRYLAGGAVAMPHVQSSQNVVRRTLSLRMAVDLAFNAITLRKPVRPCLTR